MKSADPPRTGFSLLELLVVVGIISILLAIVLGVVVKTRAAARLPICASNLRQIGAILHAYARDNRDELPAIYEGRSGGPRLVSSWYDDVASADSGIGLLIGPPVGRAAHPYLNDARLFICPGQPMDGMLPRESGDFLWNRGAGPRPVSSHHLGSMSYSYAYVPRGGDYYGRDRYINDTAFPGWHKGAFAGFERHAVAQPRAASRAVLIERPLATPYSKVKNLKLEHHGSGGNTLYLDGHVAYISFEQMRRSTESSTPSRIEGLKELLRGIDRAGGLE